MKNLAVNEEKLRDLYLRDLAIGKIQGPLTGKASIDKPWLKYYNEDDIISDIPKMKAYDYLYLNNKDNINRNALNFFGKKITYKRLFDNIDYVADSLLQIGVRPGDIVTIAIANIPEAVYLFYAINKIGAISNIVDPRNTEDQFKQNINTVNSKLMISLDMCAPKIKNIVEETPLEKVVYLDAIHTLSLPLRLLNNMKDKSDKSFKYDRRFISWDNFIKNGKQNTLDFDFNYLENMPIVLVYTGGTTGKPKAVMLTNENFVAMAHMHKNGGLDYTKDDKFLNLLPPFIAYCLCNGINMPLSLGLEVTLIPKFEANEFPKLLDKYKPNHVLAGPILWDYTIKSDISDLSYLKTPVSGGDVLNEELENRVNEFFKEKGCSVKVAQGYGMTEVSSAATFSLEKANKLGSVGIPFIKNVVSVFDPETLEELLYGEEGEIWISTPTEMLGYYDNDKATKELKIQTSDGRNWLRTSDIGYITKDGNVVIKGRMKRMIVRSGNKIFPSTIEELVMRNRNISNCSVVGVSDDFEKSVPVMHIVLSEDCTQSSEEIVFYIKNIIKQNLPEFNIPVKFVFRNSLPTTKINKVDYKSLEQEELPNEEIIQKFEKVLVK